MTPTPQELVDAFKRNGEFDKLRYRLNHQFEGSKTKGKTSAQTESLAKDRIETLTKNPGMSDQQIKEAIMADIERSPLWKALASTIAGPDFLSSPAVSSELDRKLQALLSQSQPKGGSSSSSSRNARYG